MAMTAAQAGVKIAVDLGAQTLALGATTLPFSIDTRTRRALMDGLDEIGFVEADSIADIERFEHRQKSCLPWLFGDPVR